jgi:hypothetical protein
MKTSQGWLVIGQAEVFWYKSYVIIRLLCGSCNSQILLNPEFIRLVHRVPVHVESEVRRSNLRCFINAV